MLRQGAQQLLHSPRLQQPGQQLPAATGLHVGGSPTPCRPSAAAVRLVAFTADSIPRSRRQHAAVAHAPVRTQRHQLSACAKRSVCCCSLAESAESAPMGKTRSVVEHVMLLKMPEELPVELEQDMLDHMYTLQYHYRHVLSMSLGRIFSARSDGYTHAVVARFASADTLDEFRKHPALKDVLDKHVTPLCKGMLTVDFEAQVEEDLESIFRRGEEYEQGVEHVVLLRAKEAATAEQKTALVDALQQLPQAVGPAIVQLTAGPVLSSGVGEGGDGSSFSHALIVRLPSEEDLSTYNKHPAHREVIRKHILRITEKLLAVDFHVNPVGTEERV